MEKYNHFSYGETIARTLKPIGHSDTQKHYFKATEQDEIDTVSQWISQARGVLLIAIDGAESSFEWNSSDSLMEQPLYLFAVVKQTTGDNPASIFEAQQYCKRIGEQIIAHLMQDFHADKNGVGLLDPSSFRMKGFGPVGENFYGVLLGFSFNQGINYTIDPRLWV